MARSWNPVETRLLAEWLETAYPGKRNVTRARVGAIPAEISAQNLSYSELRLLGVWRRWVDAIVWDRDAIVLVEASIFPQPGAISLLELYMRLFPMTPEFRVDAGKPLKGVLVYAVADPMIARMAGERGLSVSIYTPAWVRDYVATAAQKMGTPY